MRNSFYSGLILGVCLSSAVTLPLSAHAAPGTADAQQWTSVDVGGGGRVTGIEADPHVNGLFYMRTDMGGVNKWTGSSWVPITDSLPEENNGNDFGIESLAVDPSIANTVYIVTGQFNWFPARIFKSTNAGASWSQMNTPPGLLAGSNQTDHASRGEKLGVDPNNSNVVYLASLNVGLWKSADAANNWTQVKTSPGGGAFPSGLSGDGLSFVAFDKGGGVTGGVSSIIYVGVYDSGPNGGVWKSADGGADWTQMSGGLNSPARGSVGSDGTLFVTYYSDFSHNGGVYWAGRNATSLTSCTPDTSLSYCALAIDPSNANNVYVSQNAGTYPTATYMSTNKGGSWTKAGIGQGVTNSATRIPWQWLGMIDQLAVNPFKSGEVWMGDWLGVLRTSSISSTCSWDYLYKGHEEVVPLMLACAPKGASLLSAIADVNGERHTDVSTYPQCFMLASNPWSTGATTSLDFCESHPNVWARVIYTFNGGITGLYSTDDGINWSRFAAAPNGANGGRIAVSATNPSNFVWIPDPNSGNKVYYTTNSGATWTAAPSAPTWVGSWEFQQDIVNLASDRVNGNFYICQNVSGTPTGHAQIWVSTNGGASWNKGAILPYPANNSDMWKYKIFTKPGTAGEVWVDMGSGPIYKSTNAGATFSVVPNIGSPAMMSYGAPAPGHKNPSLFLYGGVNSSVGLFRSDDDGGTWNLITSAAPPNYPRILTADRQTFNLVYMGTNGRGIWWYGRKPGHK